MVPVGDQKQSLIVSFALVLMMSGFEKSKHLIRGFKNASRKKKQNNWRRHSALTIFFIHSMD